MVRDTSLLAYLECREEFGFMASQVFITIKTYPDLTDLELLRILKSKAPEYFKEPNNVRPRRRELERQGKILSTGKRPCEITGRTAMTWRAV